MAGKFAGDAGGAVSVLVEVVNGADVVETTARNVITAGSVCTSHDPRGPEGDSVDLVCSVGVPNDQFTILRGGHKVPPVGGPVHGVDLGQMAL